MAKDFKFPFQTHVLRNAINVQKQGVERQSIVKHMNSAVAVCLVGFTLQSDQGISSVFSYEYLTVA